MNSLEVLGLHNEGLIFCERLLCFEALLQLGELGAAVYNVANKRLREPAAI